MRLAKTRLPLIAVALACTAALTLPAHSPARRSCSVPPPLPGDFLPSWSPDGRRLVFQRDLAWGGTRIVVLDVARRRQTRIAFGGEPAWSRRGMIAFTAQFWSPPTPPATCPGGQTDILAVGGSGGEPFALTKTDDSESAPAWSPDGRRLAVSTWLTRDERAVQALFVVERATGARTQLTTPGDESDGSPVWSPDGRSIAFTRSYGDRADLFVVDTVSRAVRRLTSTLRRQESRPTWSPDGSRIAYSSRSSPYYSDAARASVYVMRADGTRPRRVGVGLQPAWSPDGRRLAFTRRLRSGIWALFSLDLRTGRATRLTRR